MPLDVYSEYDDEVLRPQAGPQDIFLSSSADIAIYGGAAGGGKTYALLLEPLRHIEVHDFGAVIFRREAVQITSKGGLYDTSIRIYSEVGGYPKLSPHISWQFPYGTSITFSHLHSEMSVLDWQGAQIPLIGYDELTHFTETQFWYMLSRNRSMCGVRPYIRATCNPDADSWVAGLIEWWIDQNTGYPIIEHAGVIRYFIRLDEKLLWADTPEELKRYGIEPKSFTFIPATLKDNQILLRGDPGYAANLQALGRVERERLLYGNWKIKPQAGSYFPATCVNVIPAIPTDVKFWVRRWDLAATEPSETNPSPSATACVLMGRRDNGRFVIADGINIRKPAHIVRDIIRNTAAQDKSNYKRVTTIIPQDPGQAGKDQAASLINYLAGYRVKAVRETGPKATRAEPISAQWQAGNIDIVEGAWNREYLLEMNNFPSDSKDAHDDYVDASSGAFLECVAGVSNLDKWRALAA